MEKETINHKKIIIHGNIKKLLLAGLETAETPINPFSSSGLTDSAAKNQKLSEADAGAIVLKSLFEEQIMMEA